MIVFRDVDRIVQTGSIIVTRCLCAILGTGSVVGCCLPYFLYSTLRNLFSSVFGSNILFTLYSYSCNKIMDNDVIIYIFTYCLLLCKTLKFKLVYLELKLD